MTYAMLVQLCLVVVVCPISYSGRRSSGDAKRSCSTQASWKAQQIRNPSELKPVCADACSALTLQRRGRGQGIQNDLYWCWCGFALAAEGKAGAQQHPENAKDRAGNANRNSIFLKEIYRKSLFSLINIEFLFVFPARSFAFSGCCWPRAPRSPLPLEGWGNTMTSLSAGPGLRSGQGPVVHARPLARPPARRRHTEAALDTGSGKKIYPSS